MEVASLNKEKAAGMFARGWRCLKTLPEKLINKVIDIARTAKKLGQDDPRRVIHSFKVGLALTSVSTFYYYQPIYDSFGVTGMWAIMTVVVVFEFSVGATLGKGLNRIVATLLAGALGVGAHHLADISGHVGEPILLALFVFLQAAISTFIRFFPKIKARYDYGLLIFILTFSLISVSGFRTDEVIALAHKRLSTVVIGGCFCVIVSIVVFPVWAGEELHNLIALNMEKLGNFLEGFGDEYFFKGKEDSKDEKTFLEGYKSVLSSKSSEENLANFASWEPGHGRFKFRHPWKKYLEVGTLTRECAYRIESLNGFLVADPQASPEIKGKVQEAYTNVSKECGKALKELAVSVRTMTQPSSSESHIENAKAGAKNLNSLLKSDLSEYSDLLQVIPIFTVASLLIDVVNWTEKIAELVYELASKAQFKSMEESTSSLKKLPLQERQNVGSSPAVNCPHVVVNIRAKEETSGIPSSNMSSSAKSNKDHSHL